MVHILVGIVVIVAIIGQICGGGEEPEEVAVTPAPTPTMAATPVPTPTMTPTAVPTEAPTATMAPQPTTVATAIPTAPPAPTATASPEPTEGFRLTPEVTRTVPPTAVVPPEIVVSRLKVSMTPPAQQMTVFWRGFQSSGGPLTPMYETLLGSDRVTQEFYPMLAEEWSMAPDGMSWNFKLRQGIPFYQNKQATAYEMTADDIVFTWEKDQSTEGRPSLGSPCCNQMTLEDFDINGDYDITFNQGKVDVTTDYQMGGQNIFMVSSRDYHNQVGEDGYQANPIGTGPFTFVDYRINQFILYERVENHWRKTPEFPELQLFYVLEDATRMAMLLTAEAHIAAVAQSLMPTVVERGYLRVPSTNPSFALVTIIGGLYYEDERDPSEPMTDVRVREAMNLAIDRDTINQVFYEGKSLPMPVPGIKPFQDIYKWNAYPYDPDRAKTLLAEAGYPEGFDLDFIVAKMGGIPEAPEIGEAMVPYFEAIGLRPHLQETTFGNLVTTYRTKDARNKILLFRGSAVADFQWIRAIQGAPYGGINAPADEELVALTDAWEMIVDPDARKAATQAIGDWFYNYYWAIPMFWVRAEVAVNPGIVADYTSDQIHFGPSRHHEFTVPVYQ